MQRWIKLERTAHKSFRGGGPCKRVSRLRLAPRNPVKQLAHRLPYANIRRHALSPTTVPLQPTSGCSGNGGRLPTGMADLPRARSRCSKSNEDRSAAAGTNGHGQVSISYVLQASAEAKARYCLHPKHVIGLSMVMPCQTSSVPLRGI